MKTTIFSIILLTSLGIYAQETAPSVITVLSSQGEVSYSPKDGETDQSIIPGVRLPPEGSIFLDEEARVRIVVQSRSLLLNGPGRYNLEDMISSKTVKSMSFTSRFWNFVMEGMGSTEDKRDLVKYHRDYMKIHGGIKGYAAANERIKLLNPIGGRIASEEVHFQWQYENESAPLTFQLMDAARKIIIERPVSGGTTHVQLNDIGVDLGATYYWSITDGEVASETMIEYVPHKQSEILEKLLYLEDYIDADGSEKSWMKAVILEMENYPYEADKIYRQLLADDKENQFLKESYAMLLSRQGRIKEAKHILNQ